MPRAHTPPDVFTQASKFLSLLLRHQPEVIGVQLDAEGWARIDELVERTRDHRVAFTAELILDLVASSDKQRFALSADGLRVRANQGHSLAVDLGLVTRTPPDVLFHGTATRFLASIEASGLRPGARQHVHLSADVDTARRVGQRHGTPCVLRVDARALHGGGQPFYQSQNGVWLTGPVAPEYLHGIDEASA